MLNKSLGDIYKYFMDHTTDESDIFQKVKEHTNAHEEFPQMLSEKIVGTLLQTLIRISRAQRAHVSCVLRSINKGEFSVRATKGCISTSSLLDVDCFQGVVEAVSTRTGG